jgi:hypothetical protein
MLKSAAVTLDQVMFRLHAQAQELTTMRAILDIQFKRIAQMQAELDLLPHARRRREALRSLLTEPFPHNGDRGDRG